MKNIWWNQFAGNWLEFRLLSRNLLLTSSWSLWFYDWKKKKKRKTHISFLYSIGISTSYTRNNNACDLNNIDATSVYLFYTLTNTKKLENVLRSPPWSAQFYKEMCVFFQKRKKSKLLQYSINFIGNLLPRVYFVAFGQLDHLR